jgi:hypothetical protein
VFVKLSACDDLEFRGDLPLPAGEASRHHDVMQTDNFTLRRDSTGQLRFTNNEMKDVPVTLTPAYPLSEPGRWLSVRAADGSEFTLIEDVRGLPSELAAVIDEEMQARQFLPIISRVHRVSTVTTGLEVDVETDHGPTTIVLDADEHIRRVSDTRVVLTDRAGVRYLIPDLRQLDQQSRHRLERFY